MMGMLRRKGDYRIERWFAGGVPVVCRWRPYDALKYRASCRRS